MSTPVLEGAKALLSLKDSNTSNSGKKLKTARKHKHEPLKENNPFDIKFYIMENKKLLYRPNEEKPKHKVVVEKLSSSYV